jgi:23S rRNA pseudouridine1911/1915/1917 synthase
MSKYRPEIIFENDDFVAVNKSSGIVSIPDRMGKELSLKQTLETIYGKIYIVHRIDRDTSGLIVFAKNEIAHKQLSQIFEERSVEKYYLGLVHGNFQDDHGNIIAAITDHPAKNGKMITHRKGKASETDYEVLQRFRSMNWLKFRIYTGRTHQIRVHMQHVGHPIVCDEMYGDGKPVFISSIKKDYKLAKHEDDEKPILSRLALHSWKLIFDMNDQHFELEAPIAKDLRALLQQLAKQQK